MVYAPGTQEKDLTKLNMSLQQNAAQNKTNADGITTNTTNIATNTTNIATNTAAIAAISSAYVTSIAGDHGAFTLSNGITNSTNDLRIDIGNLPGIATNTAASAGKIGEVITSGSVTTGSLSSGVTTNVTSISLTAGDWDISAYLTFNTLGATSTTDWTAAISTTTASLTPASGTLALHERISAMLDHSFFDSFPPAQVLISGTTSYFINVQWVGSSTAPTATAILRARRMR